MLLPLSVLLSTLLDVLISLILLVALLFGYGVTPSWQTLLFPCWLLAALSLALGAGMVAGALMVKYRDISYIVPVGVQFLLFASPVAYTASSVPTSARWIFNLNPLTGLLEGGRWSLLHTSHPSVGLTVYSLVFSAAVLLAGMSVFSRMERQFADVI
jgi:lipopolysaccharide transport system permease protein